MVTQLVTVDAVIMNIGRRASTPQHPASTLNWHSRASPLGICQGFPARLPLWGTGGLHGHLGPSPSGLLPMALFQLLWVFGMSILVKFIVFSSPILALLPPLPFGPMARLCWGTVRPDIPNFHQSPASWGRHEKAHRNVGMARFLHPTQTIICWSPQQIFWKKCPHP